MKTSITLGTVSSEIMKLLPFFLAVSKKVIPEAADQDYLLEQIIESAMPEEFTTKLSTQNFTTTKLV